MPPGQVVARCETLPAPAQIYQAAAAFVGEVTQVPPMYSALHCQGERAYRRARRGETVDLPPRTVTIYELTVDEVAIPEFTMTVTCSQGTYVRTLAKDLGDALGCGAHLTALRRLAVGALRVEEALTLAALAELGREELEPEDYPAFLAACRECGRLRWDWPKPGSCARGSSWCARRTILRTGSRCRFCPTPNWWPWPRSGA